MVQFHKFVRQTVILQDTAHSPTLHPKLHDEKHKQTHRHTCRGSGKLAFTNLHWKNDKNFSDGAVYLLGINIIITESEHNVWYGWKQIVNTHKCVFIDMTITEKMEIIFVCNKKALPQKAQFHLRLTHNISISTLKPASNTSNSVRS